MSVWNITGRRLSKITNTVIKILFAPLQGYTTAPYRKAHAEIFGGVDAYYAPFLRIENGQPREKDLRDLESPDIDGIANANSVGNADATGADYKVVPQIIANSVHESIGHSLD